MIYLPVDDLSADDISADDISVDDISANDLSVDPHYVGDLYDLSDALCAAIASIKPTSVQTYKG